MDDNYELLIDALNMMGGSAHMPKVKELIELLKALYTPEEAYIASKMPRVPSQLERIAKNFDLNLNELQPALERMCDRGTVYCKDKQQVRYYNPMPLIPGVFEFILMKGEVTDQAKRIARLFEDFFEYMRKLPTEKVISTSVPFMRVIPIEKEVESTTEILPYELISEYIEKSEYISVSTCYCRHHGELIGNPCDKPKEVCFCFGPNAKFVSDRGFGRLVSKEEAFQKMKMAEEAGLIHCAGNTSKYINFVCNCCTCHCGIAQGLKKAIQPSTAAHSNYIIEYNQEDCTGCGACIERCPMEIITENEEIVAIDTSRCIGCGLCASTCPSGALKLTLRSEVHEPFKTQADLIASMGTFKSD